MFRFQAVRDVQMPVDDHIVRDKRFIVVSRTGGDIDCLHAQKSFLFFFEPYREDNGGAVARHEQDRAQRAGQPHCHHVLLFKLRERIQHESCVKAENNAAFWID